MIKGACQISWDCDTSMYLDCVMRRVESGIQELRNVKVGDLISEGALIGYLNAETMSRFETCGFCKGEIILTGIDQYKVEVYTIDRDAINMVKELVDGHVLVKERIHKRIDPEQERYYIVCFDYWDLIRNDEFQKIVESCLRTAMTELYQWNQFEGKLSENSRM